MFWLLWAVFFILFCQMKKEWCGLTEDQQWYLCERAKEFATEYGEQVLLLSSKLGGKVRNILQEIGNGNV